MDQLDFSSVDPTENRRIKARTDALRTAQGRIRFAAVLMVLFGAVVGAAVGATGFHNTENFLSSALGAFLGVLVGVTVSTIWGTLNSIRERREDLNWEDVLSSPPDDLMGFFFQMFDLGRSTGAIKINGGDLVLIFVATSIPISAAVGADIGNPMAFAFSWQSWVGAFSGTLLSFLLAFVLFRRWFTVARGI
jgi:uncharacterized membrane protein